MKTLIIALIRTAGTRSQVVDILRASATREDITEQDFADIYTESVKAMHKLSKGVTA